MNSSAEICFDLAWNKSKGAMEGQLHMGGLVNKEKEEKRFHHTLFLLWSRKGNKGCFPFSTLSFERRNK